MLQLLTHISQDTASRCDFFPYNFGHYTTMLSWVETHQKKGQRLVTRTYNPFAKSWPKPKEGNFHDLVFLFRNPYTGFAVEQQINLHTLTSEEVLHIVANYHLTPMQKATIQAYLSRVPNSVYTVWAQFEYVEGQVSVDIVPFREPVSELLLSYPHPRNVIPEPDPILPKQGPGRPPLNRVEQTLTAIEKKRNKLHDKEALELHPSRRAFYYEMQGKPNPDRLSDAQIEAML